MGTKFYFHLYASSPDKAEAAFEQAIARVDKINELASDYLPESELSRINLAPPHQTLPLSADLYQLLKRSVEIAALTKGGFDPTAAYAIQNWRRAKRQLKLPSTEQTAKAVAMTDWRALQLDHQNRTLIKTKPGLRLDLGGIAKGYAADAALAVLREHGIHRALVAASGDLAIGDPPPGEKGWPVTLKWFEQENLPASISSPHLLLSNCACSTSGDLHQSLQLNGKRYSHIVDPATGIGLTERIACTFIAPNATTTDALATAACVLGPAEALEKLQHLPGASFYLIRLNPQPPHQVLIHGPAFKP